MNSCDLQLKDVNGSDKSLNVHEVWDFNAPKDQWKRVPLTAIAETLGVEKLTAEHHDALTAAGGERVPYPFRVQGKNVRGWNMPPLCDASKSSSICLPADTAAGSGAVDGVEEPAPVLAVGELQQETVQDAPESPESDEGLKPELVEVEAGDAQQGDTDGGAEVDGVAPVPTAFTKAGFGAKPAHLQACNDVLLNASPEIDDTDERHRAQFIQEAISARLQGIDVGDIPPWAELGIADEVRIAAKGLAQQGLRVFPCVPMAKIPAIKDWQNVATSDSEEVHKLFAGNDNYNLGIATGATGGDFDLVVVDIDTKNGAKGFAGLAELAAELGELPDTATAQTPSGGVHYYFRVPKGTGVPSAKLKTPNGEAFGDFQSHGKLVIAPPSVFKGDDGQLKAYRWIKDFPIAALPAGWVEHFTTKRASKSPSIVKSSVPSGGLITGQEADDALDALKYISPDVDYDVWKDVTALLHNVEGGEEAWREWTQRGTKWKAEDEKKWEQTADMDLAKSGNVSLLFKLAGDNTDYVNPAKVRAQLKAQEAQAQQNVPTLTNGSNNLTNSGLSGVMPAANKTLVDASTKPLGVLPSVEVFKAWCMAEGAKAYAGDKTHVRNKYQYLVSGVLAGDADVVAAYYDGRAVDWGKAVYAAAKQAAGYVLTTHQSDKSIKVWQDIDSDGQAKLLDLVVGVFKASAITRTCVNIAGLCSTDVLSEKVREGVEACNVGSAGGAAKSSSNCLSVPPSVAEVASVAPVPTPFIVQGFGAKPAYLGGTAESGGGADYLSAAVGFAGAVAEVDVDVAEAAAEDVATITAGLKSKVKESETHVQTCKGGNGAEHHWQGGKLAGLLKGDVEWMRGYAAKHPTRKDGNPIGWFDVAGEVDYGNAVYSVCHEMAKVAIPCHVVDGNARKALYDAARKSVVGLIKSNGAWVWCLSKHQFDVGSAATWLNGKNVAKALSSRAAFVANLYVEAQQRKTAEQGKAAALKARIAADDYHKNLKAKLRGLYAKPWNDTAHLAGEVDFSIPLSDDAEFLHYTKGKHPRPICTAENVALLLGYYGCRVRHNTMRHMLEYEGFGVDAGDHEGALNTLYGISQRNGLMWELGDVDRALKEWADMHKFHPVKEWIGSKPWDGVSRIEALADTITVAEGQRDMWLIYLRRWLLGAVNALYSKDGGASKHMLVLQGKQSAGKTSWFRKLAGGNPVCKDGVMLDVKNKDSVRETLTWWLVELGELEATYQTRQIAELKAFVTKQSDEWRDPFARRQNVYPRRTAFVGTVNKDEPLADFTGNTRFATVTAEKIDYLHAVDMQQVWSEVTSIWNNGNAEEKRHWLSREEEALMEIQNERYVANGVAFDWIAEAFDWSDKGKAEMRRAQDLRDKSHFMTNAQVFQLLESIGYRVTGQAQKNEVANALSKLGAISRRINSARGYYLPTPKRQTILS